MSEADRAALGLLGLGYRARRVVVGVDGAREAVRRGAAVAVVIAKDAGERARERLVPLAGHRQVELLEGPDSERLGRVLGRPAVHCVAVLDRQLARGLRAYLATWSR